MVIDVSYITTNFVLDNYLNWFVEPRKVTEVFVEFITLKCFNKIDTKKMLVSKC